MHKVLVIGATGDQGLAQVTELKTAAGWSVHAAIRHTNSVPRALDGVPCVRMDLMDIDSMVSALNDVDIVFLNLPSASFVDSELVLHYFRNFLEAASQTKPTRVVFNASLYVGDVPNGHVAHDTRFQIISQLFESSIDSTAICPVIYLDNLLREWTLPSLRDRQALIYPHAKTLPVSWICLSDVARIMMLVATDKKAINHKFIIGGEHALRGEETAAALSSAWGRKIQFQSLSIDSFSKNMSMLFAPHDPVKAARIKRDLYSIYRWYNESSPSPLTVDMSEFLKRYNLKLSTVEMWAKQHEYMLT